MLCVLVNGNCDVKMSKEFIRQIRDEKSLQTGILCKSFFRSKLCPLCGAMDKIDDGKSTVGDEKQQNGAKIKQHMKKSQVADDIMIIGFCVHHHEL